MLNVQLAFQGAHFFTRLTEQGKSRTYPPLSVPEILAMPWCLELGNQ